MRGKSSFHTKYLSWHFEDCRLLFMTLSQGFHTHTHSFNQYSFIKNLKTFIYTSDHCLLLDLYLHLHTGHFHFCATYTSQIKHVTYENAHTPKSNSSFITSISVNECITFSLASKAWNLRITLLESPLLSNWPNHVNSISWIC